MERNAFNNYRLPVPKNLLERVDSTSSPVHTGNLSKCDRFHSTPVPANGIVAYVKHDSGIGGPNPIYWKYTNFITIMHSNEEYSRYDHLAPRSSKVRVGQTVKEGQEIANVGMTGYTLLPHLHFQVFIFTGKNVWVDFDTLKVVDFIS